MPAVRYVYWGQEGQQLKKVPALVQVDGNVSGEMWDGIQSGNLVPARLTPSLVGLDVELALPVRVEHMELYAV